MRVKLPDQLLEEYWDKTQSDRRIVVPSALALLQAHGQDEAIHKLTAEGWSREFSAWLMPNVDMFRSDLEIESIPVVDDYEVRVERFAQWKERQNGFERIWKIGLAVAAISFALLAILLLIAIAGHQLEPYQTLSPILTLACTGGHLAFIVGLLQLKGKSLASAIFIGLFCGFGTLFAIFVSNDNTMAEPIKPTDHDEKVRIFTKIQAIQTAESVG